MEHEVTGRDAAPAMPDERGATVFDDLPEDVMVDKIFTRLPPKDVGRCRAVSKSWRSSTSRPEFMLKHLRCQPSLPIIDGNKRPAGLVLFGAAAAAASQQLWPFGPCRKRCCSIHLEAACDGFLIVGGFRRYYICNPTIRKHAPLPQPPQSGQGGHKTQNEIVGFYRHHPTGEYRVLWVSRIPYKSGILSEALLYIHTVGSNEPRHVEVRLPTASSPSEEQVLLKRLPYGDSTNSPPAHHRGSLHWIVEKRAGDSGDIIVFDTEAESFRWMCTPALLTEEKKIHSIKLFDMEGRLSLRAIWSEKLYVWVMQDYEAGVWAFKCQISLLTMLSAPQPPDPSFLEYQMENPLIYPYNLCPIDMVVLNKRELLIQYNCNHVLRCDIDGNFLGMVSIEKKQYRMELTRHRLRESIMPVLSSEMQKEDENFPFHTEHV